MTDKTSKKYQGAFFTPKIWVDEAHLEVDKTLGPDWRKDSIVWDCAAGSGNLTSGYNDWGELLSSTVMDYDLELLNENHSGNQTIFRYDFLNPDSESHFFDGANTLPKSVHDQLETASKAGKRLVFFINPPYGTSGESGTKGKTKAGIAMTAVKESMKSLKLGRASNQLYVQFLYQCSEVAKQYGFQDYTIAVFSGVTFMASTSFHKFRELFYKEMDYDSGFLFRASHFEGLSKAWGIGFTVWHNGSAESNPCTERYVILKDIKDKKVVGIGEKTFYTSHGKEASKWVRQPLGKQKGVDAPQMSSGLKIKEGKGCRGRQIPNSFFYMTSVANCIYKSGTDVFATSSCSSMANGFSVCLSNYRRSIALFSARKLVKETWINQKDEYLAPVDIPKFSSGLKARDLSSVYSAGQENGTLGVMCSKGNNVMKSGTDVYFLPSKPTDKGHRHFGLLPSNWRRSIALFSARKLVKGNWINDKDEYLTPVDAPKFSSGLKVKEKWTGGTRKGSLGVMVNVANSLMKSGVGVFFLSGCPTGKMQRHFDLLPSNWHRSIALFSARKLIKGNWINDKNEYLAPVDAPKFSSGLKIADKGKEKICHNLLANLTVKGPSIQQSGSGICFLSSASTMTGKIWTLSSNWRPIIALFSARKLVKGDWINDKDEYLAPNENHSDYDQWVDDCHIYALLHHSNNCTAMRDVDYKGKKWDISNHFFWLTREQIEDSLVSSPLLAADFQNKPSKCLVGSYDSHNPYFSRKLKDLILSEEAMTVLGILNSLWFDSLPLREEYAANRPELHLTCWDAGVYQLKHLWRDHFPEQWKQLQVAYKKLAVKLEPGVYKYGFLKNKAVMYDDTQIKV